MSVGANSLCEELEQLCLDFDVSSHPFYQRWSMAALTAHELADYIRARRYVLTCTARLAEAAACLAPDVGVWDELEFHAANARRRVEQWIVVAALLEQSCDIAPPKLRRPWITISAGQGGQSFIQTVTTLTVLQATEMRLAPVLDRAVSIQFGMDIAWALEFFTRGEADVATHLAHCKDVIARYARPQLEKGLVERARRVVRARWALVDSLGDS
jgi:hypothetical protein